MQKYNFFFNKAKLTFVITEEKNISRLVSDSSFLYHDRETLRPVVEAFWKKRQSKEVYVAENKKEKAFADLYSFFKVEKGAGGIVEHENGSILVIRRFGYYDFPKGHVEAGETWEQTALREVEEETKVEGLSIVRPLPETYHVFMQGEVPVLKETHWFAMKTGYQGALQAQTEEKIEEVRWVTRHDLCFMYPRFYNTLQELLTKTAYLI